MRLLLAASCLSLASCGSLFNDSKQHVSFSSDPAGARVVVDGTPMGHTPCQLALPTDRSQSVEFQLADHQPRVLMLDANLEAGWLILDLVPGLVLGVIPLVIDAATGNWNGLDRDKLHAVLVPVKAGG